MTNLALALPQSYGDSGSGFGFMLFAVVWLAFIVFVIASMWKVFVKAGREGWKALVPIYNYFVILEIVGRPAWWLLLLLIPVINLVVAIAVAVDLAKSFGKGTGFGLGLAFLGIIFFPILGFGDATYQGPAAADSGTQFAV